MNSALLRCVSVVLIIGVLPVHATVVKRILLKYKQRDVDYDRDTRHGATQGARFP